MYKKRSLSDTDKQIFLDLKPDDITKSLLIDLFSDRYDAENQKMIQSRYNTYDEFTLNKGDYPTITKPTLTNCGLFIVNKFLFEEHWLDILGGYVNEPMTDGKTNEINAIIATAVQNDETNTLIDKYKEYQNKITWLQLTFHTEICASISIKSSKPIKKVQDRKKQLLKENKDALTAGDVIKAVEIQNELIGMAKDEMKNDPTIELYESGARGSFDNAYRQDQLIKGPIYNSANNKFEIMTNSLYEGAEKTDLIAFANAVVNGLYPKAIGTAVAGYGAKKIIAILQSEVLGDRGTDCGSQYPISIHLTESNVLKYLYHFMVINGKYVRLDNTNKDKYIGKTVKMRLPSTCCSEYICNCCAGDRFYILNIKNIGLTGDRAANSLLRAKMKQSHDTTVKTHTTDLEDLIVPFKE